MKAALLTTAVASGTLLMSALLAGCGQSYYSGPITIPSTAPTVTLAPKVTSHTDSSGKAPAGSDTGAASATANPTAGASTTTTSGGPRHNPSDSQICGSFTGLSHLATPKTVGDLVGAYDDWAKKTAALGTPTDMSDAAAKDLDQLLNKLPAAVHTVFAGVDSSMPISQVASHADLKAKYTSAMSGVQQYLSGSSPLGAWSVKHCQ